MAAFHPVKDQVAMAVKGAPDVSFGCPSRWLGADGEDEPRDEPMRAALAEANQAFAVPALRVLAVAWRSIPAAAFDSAEDLWQWSRDWTFVGLAGLMDPPRPEAAAAIPPAAVRRASRWP